MWPTPKYSSLSAPACCPYFTFLQDEVKAAEQIVEGVQGQVPAVWNAAGAYDFFPMRESSIRRV